MQATVLTFLKADLFSPPAGRSDWRRVCPQYLHLFALTIGNWQGQHRTTGEGEASGLLAVPRMQPRRNQSQIYFRNKSIILPSGTVPSVCLMDSLSAFRFVPLVPCWSERSVLTHPLHIWRVRCENCSMPQLIRRSPFTRVFSTMYISTSKMVMQFTFFLCHLLI